MPGVAFPLPRSWALLPNNPIIISSTSTSTHQHLWTCARCLGHSPTPPCCCLLLSHDHECHRKSEDRACGMARSLGVMADGGVKHILCLSNGHGEDTIAANILKELMVLATNLELDVEALPLVGVGSAYAYASIPTIGPSKEMPSGGFIYMDFAQLFKDLCAGLLGLTLKQWRTVAQWMDEHPDGFLLAVGDIFPLALAWLVSQRWRKKRTFAKFDGYAFVGTAKSEYYIRDDNGKPLKSEQNSHLKGHFFQKVYISLGSDSSWKTAPAG